jgi:hypothetical protein
MSDLLGRRDKRMNDQPLTSSDSLKLLIFAMISIVAAIMIVGLIPALVICHSIFMTKKNHDFSHIDTAARFLKIVFLMGLLVATAIAIYYFNYYVSNAHEWYYDSGMFAGTYDGIESEVMFALSRVPVSISIAIAALSYFLCIHYLFHTPLRRHSVWVEHNPIFFKGSQRTENIEKERELDIIKGEKLKQYSVADEMIKWAKLKEDGHISEEEFQEAREKLLKKH